MGLDDMHDDEVRARLGLAPLGRPMTMEERVEFNAVRSMPEPFDPETDAALELTDLTRGSALSEGPMAFRQRQGEALMATEAEAGEPVRVACPGGCGLTLAPEYENHVCPGAGPARQEAPVAFVDRQPMTCPECARDYWLHQPDCSRA